MSEPWASILSGALLAWVALLVAGVPLLLARPTRNAAAWVDLLGVWAGAACAVALALGRAGFSAAWAATLLCVAVMVTATLYDRAVIMPSLAAAERRTEHDDKWARDARYFWRMSHGTRLLTLVLGATAAWVSWRL